jgi:hypothetical protein
MYSLGGLGFVGGGVIYPTRLLGCQSNLYLYGSLVALYIERRLGGLGMFAPYPDTPCFTALQVDDSRGVFRFQQ